MSLYVRVLASCDLAIFDRSTKDLYIVPEEHRAALDESERNIHVLKKMVESGKAKHFDRSSLEAISELLAKVVLLGATP